MPNIIIVCGLPGSGKTTLATALSKRLGWVCFHKDTIKESLYDSMGFSTLEDSKYLGAISMRLLFDLAQEQLARNIDLIVEAPFNFESDYPTIRQWERDYGCAIYTVICSVDDQARTQRVADRPRHASHHDADRSFNLGDEKVYERIPGKHINIVTSQSVEVLVEKVIDDLLISDIEKARLQVKKGEVVSQEQVLKQFGV
ncbi:MAG: ATP-binding protein [bacterium]|nr:ATP-binding protein [bacterium]